MKYRIIKVTIPLPKKVYASQEAKVEYHVEYKPRFWPFWWFVHIYVDGYGFRRAVNFYSLKNAEDFVYRKLPNKNAQENPCAIKREVVKSYGYNHSRKVPRR